MALNYKIEYAGRITVITFEETPTLEEVMSVIDRLAEENAYHLRLWDFSSVHFNWSMDEIRQVAEYGKARFPEENRLALVANQELAYGLFRAFQVYREQEGHSLPTVFREKKDALKWLEKERKQLNHLPPGR